MTSAGADGTARGAGVYDLQENNVKLGSTQYQDPMLTDVGAGRGALGTAGGRDGGGGGAGGSSPQSSSGALLGGAVLTGAETGAPNTGRGAVGMDGFGVEEALLGGGGTRRIAAMSGLPIGV